MEHFPLVCVYAWKIARFRYRQGAHARNEYLSSSKRTLFRLQVQNSDLPDLVDIVPFRLLHNRMEPNVLYYTVLLSHRAEIGLNLRTH